MIRACVWRLKDGMWVYYVYTRNWADHGVSASLILKRLPTWREAFDAACAELRKRAES